MTAPDTGLAGLLAEHKPVMSKYYGIIAGCQCMDRIFFSGETWENHIASVIAAAGWRRGREEWGVRYPECTNSGYRSEVQAHLDATHWNGTVVRRYVTDWEEAG